MAGNFFGWLLSVVVAFFAGASLQRTEPADSELKQNIQEHVDTIVDETAGIVDDVIDAARENENVQKAEEFADDVREIIQNTADDIEEHFGQSDETEAAEDAGETTEAE